MDDNRIIKLLTRKMAGEITLEEGEELNGLMNYYPDSVYYEEFLKELWEEEEEWEMDALVYLLRHKQRHQSKLNFNKGKGAYKKVERRTWIIRNRKFVPYTMALCFLVLLGFGLFWFNYLQPKSIEIVSEKGMRKQVVLPDGTQVWLNADSKVAYEAFTESSGCRKVRLTGEAYFDVKKDKDKPFLILTNDVTIKVLGTAFNVKAYPDDEKTEATLINGAIELSLNDGTSEKILLKPKEKLAISKVKPIVHKWDKENKVRFTLGHLSKVYVDNKELVQETSWIDNKFVFKNETLGELIPKLERWYNVNIKLANGAAKDYRFTGTITNENIDQALTAMQLINFFNFKIQQHDITIY